MNYIFFALTYALAAALQPGPFQAFIISQTLTKGWRKSFYIAFAPLISDIPILILIFFILTSLPPSFINALRLVGGFFLFYLAYKTYLSWKNMEGYDIVSDSYSMELLVVLVAERVWGRLSSFFQERQCIFNDVEFTNNTSNKCIFFNIRIFRWKPRKA